MSLMLSGLLVSTWIAVASPPASRISRVTVVIVDCLELGSGGKGDVSFPSLTVLAATTTSEQVNSGTSKLSCVCCTFISILGQVNGNLAANPARCANNQGDRIELLRHFRTSLVVFWFREVSIKLKFRGRNRWKKFNFPLPFFILYFKVGLIEMILLPWSWEAEVLLVAGYLPLYRRGNYIAEELLHPVSHEPFFCIVRSNRYY